VEYLTEMTTVRSYKHKVALREFEERITVRQTRGADHFSNILYISPASLISVVTLSFPYSDEINQENNDWEDFAE
jgi:hypothetical protein